MSVRISTCWISVNILLGKYIRFEYGTHWRENSNLFYAIIPIDVDEQSILMVISLNASSGNEISTLSIALSLDGFMLIESIGFT